MGSLCVCCRLSHTEGGGCVSFDVIGVIVSLFCSDSGSNLVANRPNVRQAQDRLHLLLQ